VRLEFIEPSYPSNGVIAEVEVYFGNDGPAFFQGAKLTGFTIRHDARAGDTFVTPPSRAYSTGGLRKYYHFLRPEIEGPGKHDAFMKRLSAYILEEYAKSELKD
jgi:hypothetical protein